MGKQEGKKGHKNGEVVLSQKDSDTSVAVTSTPSVSSLETRGTNRGDIVAEVLKDFHDAPTAATSTRRTEVPVKPRRWPLYEVRRLLGLAHVDLHDAVLDGEIELLNTTLHRYIRRYPARINEHDVEGRTALSLALMVERQDLADIIISVRETDVNVPDKTTGLFPLHTAVLLKLETSADKLAYRGANVNVTDKVGVGHLLRITYYDRPDNFGMTPLMIACRLGSKSMVEMLIDDYRAEVNIEDKAGWTCLFYATVRNDPELVERLLTCGASPEHRDKKGVKAIDWAEHMGFDDTCSVFEDFASRLVPSRAYL